MVMHLSEEELQMYILNKKECDDRAIQHIHSCQECSAKVETYRLLIKGIQQQPKPSFDFNLSELVLQQLPAQPVKVSNDRYLSWIFLSVGIALIAGASIYLNEYMSALFKNFGATILFYLLMVTALTIIAVLFIDLYKKYNREIKLLDAL